MKNSKIVVDPFPVRYFEHARAINEAAKLTLRLDTRDATALQAKISIGLSLQAAELAGKGMLLVLGQSSDEIRKAHGMHNILELLQDVDARVRKHQNQALRLQCNFMRWQPIIDGDEFGSTIGEYFTKHFSKGPISFARNYFYPDHESFGGPVPIQAIYVMVERIIDCGEALMHSNGMGLEMERATPN